MKPEASQPIAVVEERGDDTTGDPRKSEPPHSGRDPSAAGGTWLATIQGAEGDGDRLAVASLRSTPGYLLRKLRSGQGIPCGTSFRGQGVIPLHWDARFFGEGERMGGLGIHPFATPSTSKAGTVNRQPLRGEQGVWLEGS